MSKNQRVPRPVGHLIWSFFHERAVRACVALVKPVVRQSS